MDLDLRPITEPELDAFALVPAYGFGDRMPLADHRGWAGHELDRTAAAFVDGEIVATGRNYSLELTLPGGAIVPAGGVSWITTRPTHRRRGLLTEVMTHLIHDSRDRGEPVSMLTASEGGIYPRFGYGVAARTVAVAVNTTATLARATANGERLRFVEAEEAGVVAKDLFDRVRRARVGAVSRPEPWWGDEWAPQDWVDARRRFDVVYEVDGNVEGHVLYSVAGEWPHGISEQVVTVRDLVASTAEAEAALWSFLLELDLIGEVRVPHAPLDSAVPWRLSDQRQFRTESLRDGLWVRPIDTAHLLAARTYGVAGELVIDVADTSLHLEESEGTFRLLVGADGVSCERTEQDANLSMTIDGLGAIVLGGVAPSVLARAGRITPATGAALALADAMFRAEREPFPFTWF